MGRSIIWLSMLATVVATTPVTAEGTDSAEPARVKAADTTPDRDAGRDRGRFYRYDPLDSSLVAVPRSELKPGGIYNHFHTAHGRWIWSKATADGELRYAIGPGSVQQVRSFDMRGTAAEQRRALEKQAPELARLLTIQGARPTFKLDAQGQWRLGPTPHVSSVFDEATGERWEWHSDEPNGVIHACGRLWAHADGRYLPVR